jgi:hypothetical protein
VQTFLPVKSFVQSMEFLDDRRLGKQRVEAGQILEILLNKPILPVNLRSVVPFDRSFSPWSRHPAVQMWKGHEEWLLLYLACSVGEWCSRGFTNSIVVPAYDAKSQKPPAWLGYEPFHLSHRANLIRKLPAQYLKFWPEDRNDDLKYFWPTINGFNIQNAA